MKIKQSIDGVILVEFEEGEQGRIEIRKEGDTVTVSNLIEHPDRELPPAILEQIKIFNAQYAGIVLEDIDCENGWIGWKKPMQWTKED